MTVGEEDKDRIFERAVTPTEDTINHVLDVFLTPGKIPDDSELMNSISRPKLFPYDTKGEQYIGRRPCLKNKLSENMVLKRLIFREADCNSVASSGTLCIVTVIY